MSITANYLVAPKASFEATADAIRSKTGSSADITWGQNGFADAIGEIAKEVNEVTFYDYDGTILYSYTAAEFLTLTAMPPTVSDTEMTSDGWNWTLAGAKTWVTKYGMLAIGQTRVPADGSTRIVVNAEAGRTLTVKMNYSANSAHSVTINWGDNSQEEVTSSSGTNATVSHIYNTSGEYIIKIQTTAGNEFIPSFDSGGYMVKELYLGARSRTDLYTNYLQECPNIERFSMPSGVTSVKGNLLQNADLLNAIIYPATVTLLETFDSYLDSVEAISLPEGLVLSQGFWTPTQAKIFTASLSYLRYIRNLYECKYLVIADDFSGVGGSSICQNLFKLEKMYISKNITELSSNSFTKIQKLKHISIPDGLTTLGNTCFTELDSLEELTLPSHLETTGDWCFTQIRKVKTLTIPASVTYIKTNNFTMCNSMREIHLLPTTPPTLTATSSFTGTPSDCIFYVPYSADHSILAAYQEATNWSTYASKMQEEPQTGGAS